MLQRASSVNKSMEALHTTTTVKPGSSSNDSETITVAMLFIKEDRRVAVGDEAGSQVSGSESQSLMSVLESSTSNLRGIKCERLKMSNFRDNTLRDRRLVLHADVLFIAYCELDHEESLKDPLFKRKEDDKHTVVLYRADKDKEHLHDSVQQHARYTNEVPCDTSPVFLETEEAMMDQGSFTQQFQTQAQAQPPQPQRQLREYLRSVVENFLERKRRRPGNSQVNQFREGLSRANSKKVEHNERVAQLDDLVNLLLQWETMRAAPDNPYLVLMGYRDLNEPKKLIDQARILYPKNIMPIDVLNLYARAHLDLKPTDNGIKSGEEEMKRNEEKALKLAQEAKQRAEDQQLHFDKKREALGIIGRIYKERFKRLKEVKEGPESARNPAEMAETLKDAIEAYKDIHDNAKKNQSGSAPDLYGAVNLVTLMFASEDCEDHHYRTDLKEYILYIKEACVKLDKQNQLTDYWDMATYYESQVVAGYLKRMEKKEDQFTEANKLALRLFRMNSPSWTIESTARNISVIWTVACSRNLHSSPNLHCVSSGTTRVKTSEEYKQDSIHDFWLDFFFAAAGTDAYGEQKHSVLMQNMRQIHQSIDGDWQGSFISLSCHGSNETPKIQLTERGADLPRSFRADIQLVDIKVLNKTNTRCVTIKYWSTGTSSSQASTLSHEYLLTFASQKCADRFIQWCAENGFSPQRELEGGGDVGSTVANFKWDFEWTGGERVVLGEGASAKVYSAVVTDSKAVEGSERDPLTHTKLAVKVFDVGFWTRVTSGIELEIARNGLFHENVIRYYGYYGEGMLHNESCIVMEHVDGGTLSDMIWKYGALHQTVQFNHLTYYTLQLVRAIQYLHSQGIYHGDVKPDNMLVDTHTGIVKLTDFGSACYHKRAVKEAAPTFGCTPNYSDVNSANGVVTMESDIHALGCTVYQMASCKVPHGDSHYYLDLLLINSPLPLDLDDSWDTALKDFIGLCVSPDRKSIDQILDSKMLSGRAAAAHLERSGSSSSSLAAGVAGPVASLVRQPTAASRQSSTSSMRSSSSGSFSGNRARSVTPSSGFGVKYDVTQLICQIIESYGSSIVTAARTLVESREVGQPGAKEMGVDIWANYGLDILKVLRLALLFEAEIEAQGDRNEALLKDLRSLVGNLAGFSIEEVEEYLTFVFKNVLTPRGEVPKVGKDPIRSPLVEFFRINDQIFPHQIFYIESLLDGAVVCITNRLSSVLRSSKSGIISRGESLDTAPGHVIHQDAKTTSLSNTGFGFESAFAAALMAGVGAVATDSVSAATLAGSGGGGGGGSSSSSSGGGGGGGGGYDHTSILRDRPAIEAIIGGATALYCELAAARAQSETVSREVLRLNAAVIGAQGENAHSKQQQQQQHIRGDPSSSGNGSSGGGGGGGGDATTLPSTDLLEFVRSAELPDCVASCLCASDLDVSTLLSGAVDKADLRAAGLSVGHSCRLWTTLQDRTTAVASSSTTAAAATITNTSAAMDVL